MNTQSRYKVLEMLSITKGATTNQISQYLYGDDTADHCRSARRLLNRMLKGKFVRWIGKAHMAATGRPQMVWDLSSNGAQLIGCSFSNKPKEFEFLQKSLLRSEYYINNLGEFPAKFENRHKIFEYFGVTWPWINGDKYRNEVGALVCVHENHVYLILPIIDPLEVSDLFSDLYQFRWVTKPNYNLVLMTLAAQSDVIRDEFEAIRNGSKFGSAVSQSPELSPTVFETSVVRVTLNDRVHDPKPSVSSPELAVEGP